MIGSAVKVTGLQNVTLCSCCTRRCRHTRLDGIDDRQAVVVVAHDADVVLVGRTTG
jgi:hypothetical protein